MANRKGLLAHDDAFTVLTERPQGRPTPNPKPLVRALMLTAENGGALKIPLNDRDANKLGRAIYNSMKQHGYKAQVRTMADHLIVWAEKRPTILQEPKKDDPDTTPEQPKPTPPVPVPDYEDLGVRK